MKLDITERVLALLDYVESRVEAVPSDFRKFVAVLFEEEPFLHPVADNLLQSYNCEWESWCILCFVIAYAKQFPSLLPPPSPFTNTLSPWAPTFSKHQNAFTGYTQKRWPHHVHLLETVQEAIEGAKYAAGWSDILDWTLTSFNVSSLKPPKTKNFSRRRAWKIWSGVGHDWGWPLIFSTALTVPEMEELACGHGWLTLSTCFVCACVSLSLTDFRST